MNIKSGVYKHFKGGYVSVLFVAKHSDRDEQLVVYQGLNNGKYYARPVTSFLDIVENADGEKVGRFAFADSDDISELLKNEFESNNSVTPGVYRHYKGGYVLVYFTAKHSDRDEILTIYKGLNNGEYYARTVESFTDSIKDAEAKDIEPRFRLATSGEIEELVKISDIAKSTIEEFCGE